MKIKLVLFLWMQVHATFDFYKKCISGSKIYEQKRYLKWYIKINFFLVQMFTFSCPKCALFLDPNEHFLVEMICHLAQTWNTTTQSRLFLSSVLFCVFDFARGGFRGGGARRNFFKCAPPLSWNPGSAPVCLLALQSPHHHFNMQVIIWDKKTQRF